MKTEALSFCFLLSASNLISESFFILWAHAAHTGTDFSFTRKVSKSVSKRRCPLGYLLVCHETLSDKKGERDRTAGEDGFS